MDGSKDEDFIHISGIVQFGSFSWINMLPESIVVGIANVDRKRDFTYPSSVEIDKKELPKTNTLVHWLRHDGRNNKTKVFDKETPNTQRAELKFKKIGETDKYQILEIYPLTGRTHQIRAQLSKIGLPIKGDVKYGFKRGERDRSIYLHAYRVKVQHPTSGEALDIEAPLPDTNLWNFAQELIK